MHIFTVDGNIGSGKSTLIKLMKQKYKSFADKKIVYLPEPVDIWESIKDKTGKNVIENYYEDQVKFAFPFQMMAYISRLSRLKGVIKRTKKQFTVIVTERSVFTDYEIFAKMLHDEGKIEDISFNIYKLWFNEFISELPFKGVIYVRTDPALCDERIKIRNRQGEDIPIEYLEKCHTYHENWMKKLEEGNKVKVIDGNLDKTSIKINISEITNFLQEELLNKCNIVVQFSPSRSLSAESI